MSDIRIDYKCLNCLSIDSDWELYSGLKPYLVLMGITLIYLVLFVLKVRIYICLENCQRKMAIKNLAKNRVQIRYETEFTQSGLM
jgi:hypothetical protein